MLWRKSRSLEATRKKSKILSIRWGFWPPSATPTSSAIRMHYTIRPQDLFYSSLSSHMEEISPDSSRVTKKEKNTFLKAKSGGWLFKCSMVWRLCTRWTFSTGISRVLTFFWPKIMNKSNWEILTWVRSARVVLLVLRLVLLTMPVLKYGQIYPTTVNATFGQWVACFTRWLISGLPSWLLTLIPSKKES